MVERIRACLRPQDTLARLGGDEFTILLEDVEAKSEAIGVAERIAEALRTPFVVEGQDVFVSASIGIAFGSSVREHPGSLLRSADLAMFRVKETGKSGYRLFDPQMEESALERLRLEGEPRRAIERDELRVYYQPQVSLQTGRVVGMEALARWEHPERGMIPPTRFIPLAEEIGLIVPIGRWVLREACRQAREWQERYSSFPPPVVSVNLSAAQLRHTDLVEEVLRITREAGLETEALALEITESVLLEDATYNTATLARLRESGVRLDIDDFGTGYSSLSYLKRLPADVLKLDKSLVQGLERDRGNYAIVLSVITLAHALGLKVVAEGVETAEEYDELRRLKCDVGQGYYFARPVASAEATLLLDTLETSPWPPSTTETGRR
jgi:EAL domain-containing protein (putative c-di-GMP-specific phosphodiesterase class I)